MRVVFSFFQTGCIMFCLVSRSFAINVDDLAPKSILTLDDAPSFYNSKLFFGKILKGTISAKDQMSGPLTIWETKQY